ncbi:MAG: hypothetical protein ACTTIR_06040 [Eggerthia catenaformis]|uniref:hypothetical protein n=1 Tax=Eggerthia catenaformis TaxID=31973 RepID=UPI003F9F82AA
MNELNIDEEFEMLADNIRYQERRVIMDEIIKKREPVFKKILNCKTIKNYESGYLDALCEILIFITERNIEY